MDYNQGPPATFASHVNRNSAPQQVNGDAHTGEAGLEGSLQHMKLQDCAYFMRTGNCAFGSKCRYNHPTTDKTQSASYSIEELPERPGQPECQFYIKTGTCKFGPACWFHHPRPKDQSSDTASGQFQLNFLGLPLRPGERECAYYVQTGSCKFGGMCKFHHPQPFSAETAPPAPVASPPYAPPSSIAMPPMHYPTPTTSPSYTPPSSVVPLHRPASAASSPYAPPRSIAMPLTSSYQDRAPAWPVPRAPFMPPGPSMPRPSCCMPLVVSSHQPVPLPGSTPHMPQHQGMPPTLKRPEAVWPIESVHGNPQRSFDETAAGVQEPHPLGLRPSMSFSKGPPASFLQGQVTFPERLGQPDCHYYMKTGDCKFGGNCKYHHPKDRAMSLPVCLNPMGLPLRPGKPSCPYYLKHRICKFGPVCKFDHPILPYSPSQSSLNEMPVAPFVPESSASPASHGSAISEEHHDSSKLEKVQQLPTSSVAEGQ